MVKVMFALPPKGLYSLLLISLVSAKCYDPDPAFPPPSLSVHSHTLDSAFLHIQHSLHRLVSNSNNYAASSFSVEVTSSEQSLWSYHHTARDRNTTRKGVHEVDGNSIYRIASITKVFTTLGLLYQHKAGNLSLDEPIKTYIKELSDPQNGTLPWHDITLRSLASQLSGIPREFAQSDLANELDDPSIVGLPPVSRKSHRMPCDEDVAYRRACGRKDMLDRIKTQIPVFAPNQKSTYSNVAFNLIGLALENATGLSYSDYIASSILKPLKMDNTSLDKPSDEHAVLPKGNNYWDVEEGVQRPTGGLYSTTSDLSRFLRYVLTHYNGLTPAVNWFQPMSYSSGMSSFYGMPWEIFRTSKILLHGERPVTFVTKSGGLSGYYSIIMMVPEFDIGITVLTAGSSRLLDEIRELITVPLVRAIDDLVVRQVSRKYEASYISEDSVLNSSIVLRADAVRGLYIAQFISNGTDVLHSPLPSFAYSEAASSPWHAQVIPTLLYMNETAQAGERWRMQIVPERSKEANVDIWDEMCITDVDPVTYAGLALNELIFWSDEYDNVAEVELPAFRVKLKRQAVLKTTNPEPLVVQY